MNIKNIVCPTDFSEPSAAALRYASSLAHHYGSTLHVVFVTERPVPYGAGNGVYMLSDEDRAKVREELDQIIPTESDVPCQHHMIEGDPAQEIVAIANELDADLIVLGTHGRTGLVRLLMGSVAEHVVRKANCPVLALRQPVEVLENEQG